MASGSSSRANGISMGRVDSLVLHCANNCLPSFNYLYKPHIKTNVLLRRCLPFENPHFAQIGLQIYVVQHLCFLLLKMTISIWKLYLILDFMNLKYLSLKSTQFPLFPGKSKLTILIKVY